MATLQASEASPCAARITDVDVPTREEIAGIEREGARAGSYAGVRKLLKGVLLMVLAAVLPLFVLVALFVLSRVGLTLPRAFVGLVPAGVFLVGLFKAGAGVADIVSEWRCLSSLQRSGPRI